MCAWKHNTVLLSSQIESIQLLIALYGSWLFKKRLQDQRFRFSFYLGKGISRFWRFLEIVLLFW